jgi:hypothetical protein
MLRVFYLAPLAHAEGFFILAIPFIKISFSSPGIVVT